MEGEKAAAPYPGLPLQLRESQRLVAQCSQNPYPGGMAESLEVLGSGSVERILLILGHCATLFWISYGLVLI